MLLEVGALVLLGLVAVALLVPLVRAAQRQRARQGWPQATAIVDAHAMDRQSRGVVPRWHVRYQWQGRDYAAWCVAEDGAPITGHQTKGQQAPSMERLEAAARRALAKFPVGAQAPVRVNPAAPDRPDLVTKELPLTALTVVVATILGGFIVATVLVLFVRID